MLSMTSVRSIDQTCAISSRDKFLKVSTMLLFVPRTGVQPNELYLGSRVAQAEQDDVINLMSLFLQLPQQRQRKILIEKNSHRSFPRPAENAPPRELRNAEPR